MPSEKKPRTFQHKTFFVNTGPTGERCLYRTDFADDEPLLVTNNPEWLRALSAWLIEAANWMEPKPKKGAKKRAK